jgi:hypothetical protein
VEGGSLATKSREILFPLATKNEWDMGAGVGARMPMRTHGTHLWSLSLASRGRVRYARPQKR